MSEPVQIKPLSSRRLTFTWLVPMWLMLLVAGLVVAPQNLGTKSWQRQEIWGVDRPLVRHTLARAISANRYPRKITIRRDNKNYPATIQYTLDPQLQNTVAQVFNHFDPDYGVFVALNPDNGEILALVNHRRDGNNSENLALKASYPAASVFKIITAAAAIDIGKANANTVIPFNGKTTSLYRKNVLEHKDNQWTRRLPLSSAFAKSVNTVFARLGVRFVGGKTLFAYAEAFGFRQSLGADFTLEASAIDLDPTDDWSIAETAAGYTRATTLSPVHGAVIAAAAVNGGRRVQPTLVRTIVGEDGLILYEAKTAPEKKIVKADTAKELQSLMQQTVINGSVRASFKNFARGTMEAVNVGGKTGSLTGETPAGRYDWFVGYAEKNGRKLAFAAMCINRKVWYVKSATVARKAIEHFFRETG
jgi:cell division protein FtsI/penicillin-binding protein 2